MNKKSFIKIIFGSFLTTGIIYASGVFAPKTKTYHQMDIQILEQTVEELSNKGALPFDMGLELIHRWSSNKV